MRLGFTAWRFRPSEPFILNPIFMNEYQWLLIFSAAVATVGVFLFKAGYTMGRERELSDRVNNNHGEEK